jgi:hypothetical protein
VIHLKKLNQAGFDHVIMVAVFVFLFGVAGTFYLIQEHAATTTYVELHIGSTSGSCVNGATTAGCNGTDSTDEYATMSGSNFAIKSKSGACLDDWNGGVGSNAATRTYIHSTTCYGDKNQEWNWSNHRLVNVASQGCINGLGGSTGSGTQLIVYTCNSQNDEEFFETSLSSGGSSNGGGGTTDGQAFLNRAKQWEGLPYVYGGGIHEILYSGVVKDCESNKQDGTPVKDSVCDTDCSGFVSMVVDDVLNKSYVWTVNGAAMSGGSWTRLSSVSDAEPGDIVTRDTHVEFVYSGSGNSLETIGEAETGTSVEPRSNPASTWVYAYRWE